MDMHKMRQEYPKNLLPKENLDPSPFAQLKNWLESSDSIEPNAFTLATASKSGAPSSRTVLLKELSEGGLQFFTNYQSRKAREIEENPQVSGTFFWNTPHRQVLFQGTCAKISEEESAAYFHSRPRGSQIGALASIQDLPIESREELEKRYKDVEELYRDKEIPCPSYWGGYNITPVAFEFWQGAPKRLHDRFLYTLNKGKWTVTRLMP